jgi:hypothetical protein
MSGAIVTNAGGRSVAVDKRVARLLGEDDSAVIATSNCALATLRAAADLGVRTFLEAMACGLPVAEALRG